MPVKHTNAWAPFQTSRKAEQLTGAGDPYCPQKHSVHSCSGVFCFACPYPPTLGYFSMGKIPPRPSNTNYSVSLSIKRPCLREREQIKALCEMDWESEDAEFGSGFCHKTAQGPLASPFTSPGLSFLLRKKWVMSVLRTKISPFIQNSCLVSEVLSGCVALKLGKFSELLEP